MCLDLLIFASLLIICHVRFFSLEFIFAFEVAFVLGDSVDG